MRQVLKTISALIESADRIFTEDDLAGLDVTVRGFLIENRILVPARPAKHVVCDACAEDHVEYVVTVRPNDAVQFRIPCSESGWVPVSEERLRQWTIDLRVLAKHLGRAIDANYEPEELVRNSVWKLANLEIAEEIYDVIFWATPRNAEPEFSGLCCERTILIGPASELPIECQVATHVQLGDAFNHHDGLRFEYARIRSSLNISPDTNANVFRRLGEFRQVSYQGLTINLKDSVGLFYIAQLLEIPGRQIPATELFAARLNIDGCMITGSKGELLDQDARANYKLRLAEINSDLENYRARNDEGWIEKLELEKESLMKELARAFGLSGRSRSTSAKERVRKSVTQAVRRDIARVTNEHAPLGQHLDAHINSGAMFEYANSPIQDWVV